MSLDDTKTRDDLAPPTLSDEPPGQMLLLVYHKNGTELVWLTTDHPVIIGRAPPADLQIRDGELSRRHALFELVDDKVWVEDLQSTNGTWLNNQRIKRAQMGTEDIVFMGATRVSLRQMTSMAIQQYGLVDNDNFYGLLEQEINRARTFGRKLAVIMVRAAPSHPKSLPRWCPFVRDHLRPVDRIGLYSPDVVEILLPESGLRQADQLAKAIVAGQGPDSPPLLCGIAVFPESGTTADELLDVCRAALRQADEEQPVMVLGSDDAPGPPTLVKDGLVVHSPVMQELEEMVDRIAPSSIPVLILGETGTGKEVIARTIHERGERRDKPMRTINCGSIPEQLIESVMFGHEKGAFTGADTRSTGIFEEADGGSVFLDEIGEMSLRSQVALLRVLDTRKITRVGSNEEIEVNVRLLAATHQDLETMCKSGAFRSDLLFRLNTMVIRIPPLRERVEDILPLAEHFCRLACEANACDVKTFDEEAVELLRCYYWPGNVRELRNAIERAVVLAQEETITGEDLPARIQKPSILSIPVRRPKERWPGQKTTIETRAVVAGDESGRPQEERPAGAMDFSNLVQRFEMALIRDALHRSSGKQIEAAQMLGISRHTLAHKMKIMGIDRHQPDRTDLRAFTGAALEDEEESQSLDLRARVDRFEINLLRRALEHTGGNQAEAARLLGVPKYTVANKLTKHGLR